MTNSFGYRWTKDLAPTVWEIIIKELNRFPLIPTDKGDTICGPTSDDSPSGNLSGAQE